MDRGISPCSSRLLFTLPGTYPGDGRPEVAVEGPLAANDPMRPLLEQRVAEAAAEADGMPAVFLITEACRDWIDLHLAGYEGLSRHKQRGPGLIAAESSRAAPSELLPNLGQGGDALRLAEDHWSLAEECQEALVEQATRAAAELWAAGALPARSDAPPDRMGARWEFTVGLVGKPSAGKSTLFNATTDPPTEADGARVAAFPFTTITPNTGRGYAACPCPCREMGLEAVCQAGFGKVGFRPEQLDPRYNHVHVIPCGPAEAPWRRLPVLIKDVAGLVPGAYQGRGKGNAFLNDLLDADVLVHVVDVSGSTDHEGNALGEDAGSAAPDPLDEIGWVRAEIHRWIFDNVRAKWQGIVRRPDRLPAMFTGEGAAP